MVLLWVEMTLVLRKIKVLPLSKYSPELVKRWTECIRMEDHNPVVSYSDVNRLVNTELNTRSQTITRSNVRSRTTWNQ